MNNNVPEFQSDLPTKMIEVIIRLGRAQQFLKSILDDDLFHDLSKHEERWSSEIERQDEFLDKKRRGIVCLKDNLWELTVLLHGEDE